MPLSNEVLVEEPQELLGCCVYCDAKVHKASQQMSAGGRILSKTAFSLIPFSLHLQRQVFAPVELPKAAYSVRQGHKIAHFCTKR